MKLPNAEEAFIPIEKLQSYCLSAEHDEGKHKAYLFTKLLGFTEESVDEFESMLRDAIVQSDALNPHRTAYGMIYYVDFPVSRNIRTHIVRSTWIIRDGETFPRFVSCYIKRKNQA